MLFNVEPDRSVTGGAWYSDQDFESEFVDVLNQQCFKYLEQKVGCSLVGEWGGCWWEVRQRNISSRCYCIQVISANYCKCYA